MRSQLDLRAPMRYLADSINPGPVLNPIVAITTTITLAASLLVTTTAVCAADIALTPCRLADPSGRSLVRAECGTLDVPLDRDRPDAGKISLRIARVTSLSARPASVAFTVLAGGPGQAASDFYASYRFAFDRVRESFDIIIVDQRGTGESHRLSCPVPDQTLGDVWSIELSNTVTHECLDNLDVDSRYFTTSVAVQDLDAVRDALGYEQFSVYGISYGTRVAQHYLRRFPKRTHSVILDGVVPVDMALGPDISVQAQRALEMAFDRCADDHACREVFPRLRDDFRSLSRKLKNEPVDVRLSDPLSGEMIDVKLGYLDFAGAIRLLSYSPDTIALLPLYVSEAATGNYQPVTAQALSLSRRFVDALAYGMHNAVVCAEDAPFFGVADEAALDGTYLGRFVFDAIRATCEIWPRGVMDEDFKEPFASEIPVLVMSGEADPITPPAYGDYVTAYLGNARHLVGPGQGHGMAPVGCVPRLMGQFVRDRDLPALDFACIDTQASEPFFTSFSGPEP